jgi:sec-independent protein translocase protein TatB
MFDITSSKLLILGIVALLVIGPKDLPALLRTIGKYVGIIKRHAAEFRAQFDEAMRESELDQLKKDVEQMGSETEATIRAAEQSVTTELDSARQDVDALMEPHTEPAANLTASEPAAHEALPTPAGPDDGSGAPPGLNGTSHATDADATPSAETQTTATGEPLATPAKAGA